MVKFWPTNLRNETAAQREIIKEMLRRRRRWYAIRLSLRAFWRVDVDGWTGNRECSLLWQTAFLGTLPSCILFPIRPLTMVIPDPPIARMKSLTIEVLKRT